MPNGPRWIALVILVAARTDSFPLFAVMPGGAGPGACRCSQPTILNGRPITTTGPAFHNRSRTLSFAFLRNLEWRWRSLLLSKGPNGEDHGLAFSLWDVLGVLLNPTPGIPDSLALLFPLLAILFAFIEDPSAAFTTTMLFALLRTAAIRLVLFPTLPDPADTLPVTLNELNDQEEHDERNRIERLQVDVFCAGIAAATVLIVGPDFFPVVIVASIATVVLLLATVQSIVDEEQMNTDDKLLNRWDMRLQKQIDNADNSDDTDRKKGV